MSDKKLYTPLTCCYSLVQTIWLLCLLYFRGLASLHNSLHQLRGSSFLTVYEFAFVSTANKHVYTLPHMLTLTACFAELKAFTFRGVEENQCCLPF